MFLLPEYTPHYDTAGLLLIDYSYEYSHDVADARPARGLEAR